MLAGLMKSKLDSLWVSFDGTMETSFEDIREGAGFQKVVDSLKLLQKMNSRSPHKIEVGIAFVLMKKNINDLKNLDELARSVGAKKVSVSNVLPYSEEMEKEMLCLMTLTLDTFTFSPGKTEISLPRMDINNITKDTLFSLLKGYENLTLMGNRISADTRQCRFINDRCTFVRWDGKVSPCLGLLHSYKTFLNGFERTIESYTVGDMGLSQLWDIWNSKEYTKFREKVRAFDFSSCHLCGGCPSLEKNEEDCFGNTFPTCGGCLWAQGIIQCP
jgi:MoaA/NifB/PqqE/SkfB family radical SAM enzyme